MRKVMVMTALAAGLLTSATAVAAPANLIGALAPDGAVTLVRSGGGGGGGGGAGGYGGGGGGAHAGGIGGPSGGAGAHFGGTGPVGGIGAPSAGPGAHYGNNGHFGNGYGGRNDFGHGHNHRFFPGSVFVYGGGYDNYGYSGDCSWLRREARVTGSAYWWRRYQACL